MDNTQNTENTVDTLDTVDVDKIDGRVYWVWLMLVFGASNQNLWQFMKIYETVGEFANAVADGLVDGLNEDIENAAVETGFEKAEELLADCRNRGIGVLTFDCDDYPQRLRCTPNPPPVLFTVGDPKVLNASAVVAVVGSRNPCEYSVKVTNFICGQLAELGVTVISGAESGIDVKACRSAKEHGGASGAVCGRGICDERYESEMRENTAEPTVMVSEILDTNDFGYLRFDKRNRILCGLCDAVLFVECSAESHGLNNVNHARPLGRTIFVIPPADITDRRFFGQCKLLREGAIPVFNAKDIIRDLHRGGIAEEIPLLDYSEEFEPKTDDKPKKSKKKTKKSKKIQKNHQEDLHKSEMSATIDISGLSPTQKAVCEQLKNGDLELNALSDLLDISASELMSELLALQIKHVVEELPGRHFRIAKG
jgi:DNA processing protein